MHKWSKLTKDTWNLLMIIQWKPPSHLLCNNIKDWSCSVWTPVCVPDLFSLTNQKAPGRLRHFPATDTTDQWQESSSARSTNGVRRGVFERWKAGWQTFERETKRGEHRATVGREKTGLIDFSPVIRIVWQSHKVTLKPRWSRRTTTGTCSLRARKLSEVNAASRLVWPALA